MTLVFGTEGGLIKSQIMQSLKSELCGKSGVKEALIRLRLYPIFGGVRCRERSRDLRETSDKGGINRADTLNSS